MCLCTLIAADGTRIWSNDPAFVDAARLTTGLYRLTFSADVSEDVVVVQPRPEHDDVPRSLLAWPLQKAANEIDVRVDAHFLELGPGSHDHRRDLDMRLSVVRCARGGAG
jgi:hypothetical protein